MYIEANAKYGKWIALEDGLKRHQKIKCQCECGNVRFVLVHNLLNGKSNQCQSCRAAIRNKKVAKHGLRNHPLYSVWRGIKQRCENPNFIGYKDYGGRFIKICKNWKENFIEFYQWAMANGYKQGLDIDRIDNDRNYSCGHCFECLENGWAANCRWANRKINNNNRRSNHLVQAFGETKTISEWSEDSRCVVTYGTLMQRIHRNIESELALTTPGLGYNGRFEDLGAELLSNQEVMEIRLLYSTGNFSVTQLNRKFSTKQTDNIILGKGRCSVTNQDGLQEKINSVIEARKHIVTPEKEAQILELAKDENFKQSDIAKIVGFHQSHVSKVLIKNGIKRGRKNRKKIYEIQPPSNTERI